MIARGSSWCACAAALLLSPAAWAHDDDEDEAALDRAFGPKSEAPPPEGGALETVDVRPIAQYRLRYRHGLDDADIARHRARLGIEAVYRGHVHRPDLGVHVEIQDVRTFGEETSAFDTAANGLDLHQGYALLRGRGLDLRLGRQEIDFFDERLVGRNDWFEQAQAFDGVRLVYQRPDTRLDLFYALVRGQVALDAASAGLLPTGKRHLAGLHLGYEIVRPFRANVLALADVDTESGKQMVTGGVEFDGLAGEVFRYTAEGYYQGGRLDRARSQSAFRAALSLRGTVPVAVRPYAEVYGSLESGDDDARDSVAKTFVRPYGNIHDVHGIVDRFSDVARDTHERGLRDFGGALGVAPAEELDLRVAHHLFQVMQPLGDLVYLGHELDVAAGWRFWRYAGLDAGYGVFFPGGVWRAQSAQERPQHFVYVTANLAF